MRSLILLAAAGLSACTCSPAIGPELKFACTNSSDCADGFTCRGGECRTTSGGGGGCMTGETKACTIAGCTQACGTDAGFQTCAPTTGGAFASNPDHCGECGRACFKANGLTCVNSHCTCLIDSDCPAGDVCAVGGICVNGQDSCAALRCPAGEVCRQGTCGPVSCATGCGSIEICDAVTSKCRPVLACRLPKGCPDGGGVCDGDNRPDGTKCNDGQACTFGDVCTSGACAGTTYTCGVANQCQGAGACLGDGGCSGTRMPDNTPCDDAVDCTAGDHCTAGVCAGSLYACTPNQCAATSACAGDGGCLVTARNIGAQCDDANACSIDDFCSDAGFCNGTLYTCPTPTTCQLSVACAGDGGCLIVDKADGAACDDGKVCTTNDLCTATVCGGTVGTTYQDLDGDGRGNANIAAMTCPEPMGYVAVAGDCNDGDPDVYQFLMVAADVDHDGLTATTTLTGTCVGTTSLISGRTYYKDLSGQFTWLGAASPAADCNDNDVDVFQNLAVARDLDQDGVTATTTTSTQCVGASALVNGRTYYADSGGAFTWLLTASGAVDCLDSDADVFQNVSVIEDVDQDGYGALTSSIATRCVGNFSIVGTRTYHRSATGVYSWLVGTQNLGSDCNDTNATIQGTANYYPDADGDGFGSGAAIAACAPPAMTAANNTDCLEGNANIHTTRTVFTDVDQDGYTLGAAGAQCTGNAAILNGRTYYKNSTGTFSWIATSLGADCDDANPTVTVPSSWYTDGDTDGYGTGVATVACTAPLGKTATNSTDCNDANGNVNTNRFVFPDADQDGYTDGAQATQCTGNASTVNGRTYYRNATGGLTWIASSLGGDCNTSDGTVFQSINQLIVDNDRDGYPPADVEITACVGVLSMLGGRAYYLASGGGYRMVRSDCIGYTPMMGGTCPTNDCYDANANARVTQTLFFTAHRGDGSFDYDCSGSVTSNTALTTYCASPAAATLYSDAACTLVISGTRCGSVSAVTFPASCGLFNPIAGSFYNPSVCTGTSRQGTTQIACH